MSDVLLRLTRAPKTNMDETPSSGYSACFVLIRVEEIDPEAGSDLGVRGGS